MKKITISLLRGYKKYISPYLGYHCNFMPSCSEYAVEAIQKYGFFKGCYLGIKRVLRCHPWRKHTFDPVP